MMRTRHVGWAFAVLVLAAALAPIMLRARTSSADIVPGEFSMEVRITPTQADLNVPFTVGAGIYHTGMSYQAVQWDIAYDPSLIQIDIGGTVVDPSAPSACISKSDNGVRVLLGCIDLGGPNLTYSGNAWNVSAKCIANGTANFVLELVNSKTFVKSGATLLPVHTHDDSIFCGPPPPTDTPTATNTPLPPTFTPTRTPTRTSTPTRTPSATPTIEIPPGQNQFQQTLFSPTAYPTGTQLLNAVQTAIQAQIGVGWSVEDVALAHLYGSDRLIYSQQRVGIAHRADLSGDDFIDLTDVLLVLQQYGQPASGQFRHQLVDVGSYPTGAQLLAAIDAQAEQALIDGWDVKGTTELTLDGSPKVLSGEELRNPPPSADVNGDGLVDISDAIAVVVLFNTSVPPVVPNPLPPQADRFQQEPTAVPGGSLTPFLADQDFAIEQRISSGWDPINSQVLTLDGTPSVVQAYERSLRPLRADQNGDHIVDLSDTIEEVLHFGENGISAFKFVTIDPSSQPNESALVADIDAAMEAQIQIGWKVTDVVQLDDGGSPRLVFGLELATIPQSPDLNGDGIVDITDALISLLLFNTPT